MSVGLLYTPHRQVSATHVANFSIQKYLHNIGITQQLKANGIVKEMFKTVPEGKRLVGKPRKRWL